MARAFFLCEDLEQANEAVDELMLNKMFGDSGNTIVIEEFMTGREVSVLSFVDGDTIKIMSSAMDHKKSLQWRFRTKYGRYGQYITKSILYKGN